MDKCKPVVGIIGLGYVGLTLAIAMSLRGFRVYGKEKNQHIINKISEGSAHFQEKGIDKSLGEVLNKNFFLVDEFPENELNCCLITVGTPIKDDKSINFDYILECIRDIPESNRKDFFVGLRSTVAVGTCRNIFMPKLKEKFGKSLDIVFCPERTIEGDAINELFNLPQIIGGSSDYAVNSAEKIFKKLTKRIVKVSSLEAAELVKLFNNTYRDINFALGNYFNMVAQSFNTDGIEVINASNIEYVRGGIPKPGFVGGPCLEKDPYILAYDNFRTKDWELIKKNNFTIFGRKFNERLPRLVGDYIIKNLSELKITVSGLAFKGVPETSDLRGSPTLILIDYLIKNKISNLTVHDFVTSELEIQEYLPNLKIVNNLAEDSSDVLVICNNHKKYSDVDPKYLQNYKMIIDPWNNPIETNSSTKLVHLGNMFLE